MFRQMGLGGVILAVAFAATFTDSAWAFPPRDPGAKMRDDPRLGFWSNQRAARNLRHARDYSRGFYVYSRDAHHVQPGIAKSESTELGRNIESAKKELGIVREQYSEDKEVLDSLAVIEEHLRKASDQHKTLHAACQKDEINPMVGMECCNVITQELEKAMAEHAALMRQLEIRSSSTPTAPKLPQKD